MMPINHELTHWHVDGDPFVLECTEEVIEQLRQWSLTADLFPPQRGTLWGKQEGHTVAVSGVSWHALSEDRKTCKPVGWFQIRMTPTLHLDDDDVAYCNKHFSAPGGMALILRPEDGGSVRAGVFFRELNGELQSASSYQEATIPPGPEAVAALSEAVAPLVPIPHQVIGARMPPPKQGGGMWMPFLTGTLAGAVAFAAIWHVHAAPMQGLPLDIRPATDRNTGTPLAMHSASGIDEAVATRTHELVEQTRQLQIDLDAEKVHNRRLEVTLEILRDRLRIRTTAPTPISHHLKAKRSTTPLY